MLGRLLVCAVLLMSPAWVLAASADPQAPQLDRMTSADLGGLFDSLIPAQLARNDIAGATVAVVRDGKLVFAKGYGYANAARRTPVSATETLFRIGSVSKLMTWTAVMQLVEQGKIDLSADVNQYLDFRIPDAFGKPVTMRHLMTHTAGFEDAFQGLWRQHPDKGEHLQLNTAMRVPQRIFAPGTVAAYSNYGAALAGYIVQRVSGEPFDAYVARHITGPLGMSRTTFVQPLPAALAPHMSSGYRLASGSAMPFELMLSPAGGASATATDMARFMLTHLGGGSLGGVRILKTSTASMMHSRQHAFDVRDNAMGLGWTSILRNGQRIIGHDGATFYFHSNLMLIPAAGVGVFVAYNSTGNGAGGTLGPVFRSFLNRYYRYAPPTPTPTPAAAPAPVPPGGMRDIEGAYMPSRRGQSNLAYLAALLGQTRVVANDDGTIRVEKFLGESRQPAIAWRQGAPGYWQDSAGLQRHLIFRRDPSGRWEFSDGNPSNVHQHAAWHQDQRLVLGLLVFSVGVSALSVAAWPVAAWRRRRRPVPGNGSENAVHARMHLAAGINLSLWALAAALAAFAGTHIEMFPAKWFDVLLQMLQIAAWLSALGIGALIWQGHRRQRGRPTVGVVIGHQALVWAASLASLWLAFQINLLTVPLGY